MFKLNARLITSGGTVGLAFFIAPFLMGVAFAQDMSDPATILMMNAKRRGLVPANTPLPVGGDLTDPSTIIMMNAQRRGLIPNTTNIPVVPKAGTQTAIPSGASSQGPSPFSAKEVSDSPAFSSEGKSSFDQGLSSGGRAEPQISGGTAQSHFDQGCNLSEARDFKGAVKEYDQAIQLDPNFGKAYANRGSARFNAGDRQGALDDFDQAVRLLPDNPNVKALRDQIAGMVGK
jgi:hypothetical protein